MAILTISKENLIILGILPMQNFSPKLQKYQTFINRIHTRLLFVFLFFYITSVGGFILFKAKDFNEYSEATFYVSVSTLSLTLYSVLFWKKSDLNNFIEDLENIIEQSKQIFGEFSG